MRNQSLKIKDLIWKDVGLLCIRRSLGVTFKEIEKAYEEIQNEIASKDSVKDTQNQALDNHIENSEA